VYSQAIFELSTIYLCTLEDTYRPTANHSKILHYLYLCFLPFAFSKVKLYLMQLT